jgi:hypothetical protein
MYREARPIGVNELQRLANLSSPSVAYYHLRKLVNFGLAREEEEGYVVDRIVFENMIRIGSSLIPIQAAFATFFVIILASLVTVFRPQYVTSDYAIALIASSSAFSIFLVQTVLAARNAKSSRDRVDNKDT